VNFLSFGCAGSFWQVEPNGLGWPGHGQGLSMNNSNSQSWMSKEQLLNAPTPNPTVANVEKSRLRWLPIGRIKGEPNA
jgi:hypothetical protein